MAVRLGLAVVFLFAFDAAAFRTGWYASILEPNSTAGSLQTTIWVERHRAAAGLNQVLAVGDSRIPLRPRAANALTAETGYTFATIAVWGTTPRCWYYMLREVDPGRNRYAAIIVPFDTYNDRISELISNRDLDIRYLTPLLRLSDLADFSRSFPSWTNRLWAVQSILLKGLSYQRDFQDFLVRHKWRLRAAKITHDHAGEWMDNAEWDTQSLAGMSVDWGKRTLRLPDSLPADKRGFTRDLLLNDPPPREAWFTAYRRLWFGRIVKRYRGTRTRLIFIRLPRGPVVRPGWPEDKESAIREFGARGDAILTDENYFNELERPELFGDALHMNGPGGDRFSRMLQRLVRQTLGPPEGPRR